MEKRQFAANSDQASAAIDELTEEFVTRKRPTNADLDPKQQRALAALLTSRTQREAAEKAKISERALRDYLRDETFSELYHDAARGLVDDALQQARMALGPTIEAMQRIATDDIGEEGPKVAAARCLLDFVVRLDSR